MSDRAAPLDGVDLPALVGQMRLDALTVDACRALAGLPQMMST